MLQFGNNLTKAGVPVAAGLLCHFFVPDDSVLDASSNTFFASGTLIRCKADFARP